MISQKSFYFIRHGQTEWNKRGVAMGQTDIPLNEVGLRQARHAAKLLQSINFETIVASPLLRARKTAEIIEEGRQKPVVFLDAFKEAQWGVRQGQFNGDESWLANWRNGDLIEGAETFIQMQERVAKGLEQALQFEGPILIVAHGGVYWALRVILGLPFEDTHNANPYYFRALTHSDRPHQPWFVRSL